MPPKRQSEAVLGIAPDEIDTNALGSLRIDDEELDAAFDFFDVDRTGKITAANLRDRLGAFYKNLPQKEIKLLLGNGPFTKDTLRSLLQNNDLGAYDPTKEAFKAYDPNGTGFVDTDTLRTIFSSLGYGEITDDDLHVLIDTADVDRDGRISLEDFRGMCAARCLTRTCADPSDRARAEEAVSMSRALTGQAQPQQAIRQ
jgi:calmodulin